MTVYYFNNKSPGAPAMPSYNTNGSFIPVLDFCLVTGMGWEKVYSGTNTATYRAPTGNRYYLGVDDNQGTSGRTYFRGFKTVTTPGTAESSGTNPFPTNSLKSGGESSQIRGNPNYDWNFVSNGKIFYFVTSKAGTWAYTWSFIVFGDFISYVTNDTGNTLLSNEDMRYYNRSYDSLTNGRVNLAISYLNTGTAVPGGIMPTFWQNANNTGSGILGRDSSSLTVPNSITGKLHLGRIEVCELAGFRGKLPGIYVPLDYKPFTSGAIVTDSGTGKTFLFTDIGTQDTISPDHGQIALEISDTWETY